MRTIFFVCEFSSCLISCFLSFFISLAFECRGSLGKAQVLFLPLHLTYCSPIRVLLLQGCEVLVQVSPQHHSWQSSIWPSQLSSELGPHTASCLLDVSQADQVKASETELVILLPWSLCLLSCSLSQWMASLPPFMQLTFTRHFLHVRHHSKNFPITPHKILWDRSCYPYYTDVETEAYWI